MEQLTAFERSLLEQFETLARASETALDGSEKTSEALRELSSSVRVRLDQIERKQREIEAINRKLIELLNRQIAALNGQSDVTESLAKQVNALRSRVALADLGGETTRPRPPYGPLWGRAGRRGLVVPWKLGGGSGFALGNVQRLAGALH